MFISLATESFDDEDLVGSGKIFDVHGKLNGHLVNEIEEPSLSHYIMDLSERPGNWDVRDLEVLSNSHVFAGNHFDGLLAFSDIEISNDPNRDDNSGRDDINNRGNDGAREYFLDKFERFFNGDYGTVSREVYEEIVEPAIIELSQAVGDQLTQHETQ